MRLVVGMSGGSGVIYAIRLLEILKQMKLETHLIITPAARETIVFETDYPVSYVESLASISYRYKDISAAITSGSFPTDGMVVVPCSMKTLSGIAHGYEENLLIRAALVTLKERTAVFHHKMGGTGIRNLKLFLNLFTTYYQAARTGR